MYCFLNTAKDFLNPETIIHYGGFALLVFIIFAETGLFFGFFLPGDSLLFMAGLLANSEYLDQPISVLIPVLILAAVLGTTVGYWFGFGAERFFKNRKENFFYKQKYIDMTHEFYGRYGMMAFVLGRFMPIVRTFVPILAGMVKIEFKRFLFFNILGASIWICTMILSGHWLGRTFPNIIDHLEIIIVSMIVISVLPVIFSWIKHQRKSLQ